MNPTAILVMTSLAFVIGVVSWALPAWKYHKHTQVGKFSVALLFAGIVFISMFKWSDIVLDVWGAKLQITERDQKIAILQTSLSNARTALAQVQKKAPDTAELASSIQGAMQKAGYNIDQTTVKTIADDSLRPLDTYLKSPQWYDAVIQSTAPHESDSKAKPADFEKRSGPTTSQSQRKPSKTIEPMVLPNDAN